MQMYSALYECYSDPFGIVKDPPIAVKRPEDIPDDAKGYLLLHGGEDISPSIYNEKNSRFCHAPSVPSNRDKAEIALVKRARDLDLVILGICRGAQLLCALDGGKLVQHIIGHHDHEHIVQIPDTGITLGKSNTAHHQMMVPRQSKMTQILGVVPHGVMGYSEDNTIRDYTEVPEIVSFSKLKGFGVQFHPEWMKPDDAIVKWCRNYILINIVKD